jgi:hypothetical protein
MMTNKDKTGNERQTRRREKEKAWLKKHGYKSWESLHTALMRDDVILQVKSVPTPREPDRSNVTQKKRSGK